MCASIHQPVAAAAEWTIPWLTARDCEEVTEYTVFTELDKLISSSSDNAILLERTKYYWHSLW